MLQIATGMYFGDRPMYETTHRGVFHSNATALRTDPVELSFGRLLFSSGLAPISAVTFEVVDRLPEVEEDGSGSFMVATGGTELLNDAASVFSFWGNVTCSRHLSVVERLVPRTAERSPSGDPSTVLRRTFDPQVMIRPDEFDDLRRFGEALLALRRRQFEAAMRAIRTVVAARTIVGDDPALAYSLFVAALEALAQVAIPPESLLDWDRYDPNKRIEVDPVLDTLDPADAEAVRSAILRADQRSLGRRFKAFVLDHVEPGFYRAEATGLVRPVRACDLPHALDIAYRLRSRHVHELRDLEPELWVIADRADTLPWDGRTVLSLEGLNRLSQHVIRRFVERSPEGLDETFDYRAHLPGIVQMQLAPEYWIGRANGFTAASAGTYLQGFVDLLRPLLLEDGGTLKADLTPVLELVERLLPAEAKAAARRPMIALYALWHRIMAPQLHRPNADALIDRFGSDLDEPSIESFVVRLLLDGPLDWTPDDTAALVSARRRDLERGRGLQLARRLDTALVLHAAKVLWDVGRVDEGRQHLAQAVELLPGDDTMRRLEEGSTGKELPHYDLRRFALGADDWLAVETTPGSSRASLWPDYAEPGGRVAERVETPGPLRTGH